jgi:hypothetical protein
VAANLKTMAAGILFSFYSELMNDDNKTSGNEAWTLVCSINRRM